MTITAALPGWYVVYVHEKNYSKYPIAVWEQSKSGVLHKIPNAPFEGSPYFYITPEGTIFSREFQFGSEERAVIMVRAYAVVKVDELRELMRGPARMFAFYKHTLADLARVDSELHDRFVKQQELWEQALTGPAGLNIVKQTMAMTTAWQAIIERMGQL
jgi:hypothetical protein